MFVKPFRVKSNSQVKGSEKKKFRAEIRKAFPHLTEEDCLVLVPNKEELSIAKVLTHSEESTMVYSVNKTPVIFEHDRSLYPTVHALWQVPHILPVTFVTMANVIEKLQNGADLMIPGIVLSDGDNLGPRSYGKFERGEKITICIEENSAAIAVGKAALSSFDMYMAARRGKGVQVLHVYGDLLWAFGGGKAKVPNFGPPGQKVEEVTKSTPKSEQTPVEVSENSPETASPLEQANGMTQVVSNVQEDTTTTSESESEDESPSDILNNALASLNAPEPMPDPGESTSSGPPPEDHTEMDALILYCFIKSWKTTAKKATLPILNSQFYALHMLPAVPRGYTIDLKKSGYKKFSRFLDEMQARGAIRVEELSKGVASIVHVDPANMLFRHFQEDEFVDTEPAPTDTTDDEYQPPQIQEVHIVTANVLQIFKPCGYSKGDGLTMVDIRKGITEYVKREDLQCKEDKAYVMMNPLLTDCCLSKAEYHVKTKLKWEEVSSRCASRMTPAFKVSFKGRPPVMVRGKLEPIDLQVMTRSGNKKVTLVHNLDVYGIDHHDFARRCRVGVQASTTIGTAPDKKGLHVLVQGNQVNFIAKLITEEYKLNKKYLRGLENAPKKKKR